MKTFKQYLQEVRDRDLLARFAKKQGVALDMDDDEGNWYVNSIERRGQSPRGRGAKVMRAVTKLADKREAHVGLHSSNSRLHHYYKQFGFEHGEDGYMERSPKKPFLEANEWTDPMLMNAIQNRFVHTEWDTEQGLRDDVERFIKLQGVNTGLCRRIMKQLKIRQNPGWQRGRMWYGLQEPHNRVLSLVGGKLQESKEDEHRRLRYLENVFQDAGFDSKEHAHQQIERFMNDRHYEATTPSECWHNPQQYLKKLDIRKHPHIDCWTVFPAPRQTSMFKSEDSWAPLMKPGKMRNE